MWQCCDLDAALEIQATSTQSPPQAHHSWATRRGSVPIQRPSRPRTKSPIRERFLKEVFSKIRHLWLQSDREQDNSMPGKDYCSCYSKAIAVAFIFQPLLSRTQYHWGWRILSSCAQWKRAAQLLNTAPLCPPHYSKAFSSCREL